MRTAWKDKFQIAPAFNKETNFQAPTLPVMGSKPSTQVTVRTDSMVSKHTNLWLQIRIYSKIVANEGANYSLQK